MDKNNNADINRGVDWRPLYCEGAKIGLDQRPAPTFIPTCTVLWYMEFMISPLHTVPGSTCLLTYLAVTYCHGCSLSVL